MRPSPVYLETRRHEGDLTTPGHVIGGFNNSNAWQPWIWQDGVSVNLSGAAIDAGVFRVNSSRRDGRIRAATGQLRPRRALVGWTERAVTAGDG